MTQPTTFGVSASNYSEDGYVHITWTGDPSVNHYSYRVYRLDPEASTWTLIKERTDTAANYTYDDYFAPVGNVFYAVVEVTAVGSVQTEENKTAKHVTLSTPYYWLLHPTDMTKHILLRGVTGEKFKDEHEVAVKKLIGRGRKIDRGDRWGRSGSIDGKIFDRPGKTARQARLDLEEGSNEGTERYMRNPFGDMWKIWFEDPEFDRIPGVGTSEYVGVSFSYYEVA